MAAFLKLIGLLFISLLLVGCVADNWIGPGIWSVTGDESCANPERYPFTVELFRKRINRTHDGFGAHFVFPETLDHTLWVHIVVCKYVDGGCKPYRVIAHDSFQEFCYKIIGENVQKICSLSGIDPPDFPVKAGEYKMEEYLLNYDAEWALQTAAYGAYRATLYLTKNSISVSCHVVMVEFNEIDE